MNLNVFVYGTLKSDGPNNYLLKGSRLLATDEKLKGFQMYTLGAFPALTIEGETTTGHVVGEVYQLNHKGILEGNLDSLEGYPTFYNRKIITTESGIEAWVYYIEGTLPTYYYDAMKITSGIWQND